MKTSETIIEKATWDLSSERIQLVTGLILGLTLLLFSFQVFGSNILTRTGSVSSLGVGLWVDNLATGSILNTFEQALNQLPMSLTLQVSMALHAGTAILVALICLDISLRYGKRTGAGPAIWAGLLYLAYPASLVVLSASDGTRIALGMFLAITSFYTDLRFRVLKESWYLVFSLLSIGLSTLVDPIAAATGIIGILASRAFIPSEKLNLNSAKTGKTDLKGTGYFVIALIIISIITGLHPPAPDSLNYPGLKELLSPLIFGNEQRTASLILISSFFTVCSLTAIRIIAGTAWVSSLFFVICWSILVVNLNTSIFSSLSPTLVTPVVLGCYYAAAPLVSLLVLMALPASDVMQKVFSLGFSIAGSLALGTILTIWGLYCASGVNQLARVDEQCQIFESKAGEIINKADSKLYLIGIPNSVQDFIKRVENPANDRALRLEQFLAGIIGNINQSANKYEVVFMTDFGFIELGSSDNTGKPDNIERYLAWSDEEKHFLRLSYEGESHLDFNFDKNNHVELLPQTAILTDKPKLITLNEPFAEPGDESLVVFPGVKELTLWLPETRLDPSKIDRIELTMTTNDQTRTPEKVVQLIFKGKSGSQKETQLKPVAENRYIAEVSRLSSWLSNDSIAQVGLKLKSGPYSVDIKQLKTLPAKERAGQ
ncbi:MAG: hypothetical protein K8F91_15110 [Candidatus Obscuribacterales bacterium]|nr:hypothetical protein [Candidatus Obscuribacterales bacterium]